MKLKNTVLALSLALIAPSAFAASTLSCKPVSCVGVQPNGGSFAPDVCNKGYIQAFDLSGLEPSEKINIPAEMTMRTSDGSAQKLKAIYTNDMGGGYDLTSVDKNGKPDGTMLHISADRSKATGLFLLSNGFISYVTYELACTME